MVQTASQFAQLLGLSLRNEFHKAFRDQHAERQAKGFGSGEHYVALLYC